MTAFRASVERLLQRVWYEGHWFSFCLVPLSWLVEWEVKRRSSQRLPKGVAAKGAKVWVIGGLTVGGTGKTPVLLALAEWLRGQNVSIGVISRGYRGRLGNGAHVVSATDSAADVGDEPLLIQRRLNCPVVIGRDRFEALTVLLEQFDVDIVLADDGLQHNALPRDLEVVVLDAERGLGNGRVIPAGPLREPATRLATVDWILERNSEDPDRRFSYRICAMRQLASGQTLPWTDWHAEWGQHPITAVTALGQPTQFFEMLSAQGLTTTPVALPDHEPIPLNTLEQLTRDVVVTTAKDAVKLGAIERSDMAARVWVVEIETELPSSLLTRLATTLSQR